MIRVALPGGRLSSQSRHLLTQLVPGARTDTRRYAFTRGDGALEVLLLKVPDIPTAVERGHVDVAVASDEWIAETGCEIRVLDPLCWYHVTISLLAPQHHTVATGGTYSVATPYPRLAARLLPATASITTIAGAVEAYPGRFTDTALDCVETGGTAAANGLVVVRELMRADVRIVVGAHTDVSHPLVREVISVMQATAVHPDCDFGALNESVIPR
ncbi:ATP phosphoribosyltransferase (plasmid) [Nocardia sp. NBC_01377]|uniref:ATP phosphoribosyltransferase n=1 Tax=Nocardia sp. NBC_01377 TaxID=2903595 RepID=UPI002F90F369